ncbi:hypothetical protein COCC4DRAFT_207232 [Bipolaris maydis ATCC 48331]|uniref:PNPLA domain-containing protein n=2 Tax=Cochliobolus heterostrophus TaxID=5016 RepID=M2TVR2_COCH5|nr:uncharacterized protein COCC4DRAFT_207232 [Bipolaris maydis ATCC 48331]EMD85806.1 hypothetical protein COCHEDRAFT_1117492 [Bipolaris maydis C5]KAH7558783.1 hypothetical protein BM1_04920 [Bipolaris maydis]ENH99807.1 hypothetical protein COCC4DRAFT_207232 [Bipolaris maydis ATCC 48331]KAJ5026220.1 acyl transferase/acyl hydrolase/lysophospholipase [Bipolaris maydis]KAJ5056760.1 acyl transferase/acyl hydrolase/lysophospholipase [Bipolaris maydis]
MLQPPREPASRPLSIRTTGTTATQGDKTGETWKMNVTAENCWEDLILTLDGGGIRGYSSLLIIQQLMHEIAECERRIQDEEGPVPGTERREFKEDELLPCHYFDYMYGTSTGGLISVMLARLRMTVPQCLEIYRKVGNELFGHRRNILPLATKYDHKPLEKAVQDIVKQYCKEHGKCTGDDWYPWRSEEDQEQVPMEASGVGSLRSATTWGSGAPATNFRPVERICQSICLTAIHSGQIDEAYLLRSYNHQYDPDIAPAWVTPYNTGADKMKIWQVTRATSAAPFYFEMLTAEFANGLKKNFKDGGIRENNPSYAAYSEHASLKGDDKEPALLLSIGTGRPDTSNDGFATAWPGPLGKVKALQKWSEKLAVFKNLLIKYTEGEDRHKMMRTIAKGEHRWYKRLNVDKGLEGLPLDHWVKGKWTNPQTNETKVVNGGKTLTIMETVTRAYLDRITIASPGNLTEYQPPKIVLKQVAERLVRHRRLREATKGEDLKRWQTHMGQWLTGELKPEDAKFERVAPKSRKGSRAFLSSPRPMTPTGK